MKAGKIAGHIDQHEKLGKLGSLKGERAQAYPAPRAVYLEADAGNQHQNAENHRNAPGKMMTSLPQRKRQDEHQGKRGQADQQEDAVLPDQTFADRDGSRSHHDGAEH